MFIEVDNNAEELVLALEKRGVTGPAGGRWLFHRGRRTIRL